MRGGELPGEQSGELGGQQPQRPHPQVRGQAGLCLHRVRPGSLEALQACREVFSLVEGGFLCLAAGYPEYIRLERYMV